MEEENVLFNNALNTFYLRLYDVSHMVNDHSDSERGNHYMGYSFRLAAKNPTDTIVNTTAFSTPVVEH